MLALINNPSETGADTDDAVDLEIATEKATKLLDDLESASQESSLQRYSGLNFLKPCLMLTPFQYGRFPPFCNQDFADSRSVFDFNGAIYARDSRVLIYVEPPLQCKGHSGLVRYALSSCGVLY